MRDMAHRILQTLLLNTRGSRISSSLSLRRIRPQSLENHSQEWKCYLGTQSGRSMFDHLRTIYQGKNMTKLTLMPKNIELAQFDEDGYGELPGTVLGN